MGPRRGNRKRKRASESEVQAVLSGGGEILKAKKAMQAAVAAQDLLLVRKPREQVAKTAVAGKKRKKVIKTMVPKAKIDEMIAWPDKLSPPIPEDELAKRSKTFRDFYYRTKNTIDKTKVYFEALINQYKTKGYAEDEREVTDDDEELVENQASIQGGP